MIEGLGFGRARPVADEVVAEPLPSRSTARAGPWLPSARSWWPTSPTSAVASRTAASGSTIRDTHVAYDPDIAGFDLERLSDFESAVEFIRDHDWAWAIFDAPAAQGSDLDIATQLYLETLNPVPATSRRSTGAVIEANRQASGKKRSYCSGPLGEGKRYRDALKASLALSNEITAALGLVVEPTSPPVEIPPPTSQPATPAPSPTPAPTPEPTPPSEPAESSRRTPS